MDDHRAPTDTTPPRARIAPLPPAVIERIAAGEVIERPASVVRELVENALDAGARTIRIELRAGGLRLIRVADDGCGISPQDLPLTCAPHATSKIAVLADLEHIVTLGFRGEALASIAAVGSLEIASAADESGIAQVITTAPERPPEVYAIARPRGTTVTVRDLFAAVPARLALLRGPRTEAARVTTLLRAYALIHPDTAFTLVADGNLALQTHGAGLHAAVTALYGPDIERALLPLGPLELHGVRLDGVVASHAFSHPARDHIVLAINGRPIHNRTLLAAIESGYRPLLRKGRHPVLVAQLTTAPERLDANIHPTKAEVLLKDETLIAPALRESIHRALGSVPRGASLPSQTPGMMHYPTVQLRLPLPRKRRGLLLGDRRIPYIVPPQPDDARDTLAAVPALESLAQFDDTLILARAADGHLYLVDQHRAHERALYEQLLYMRNAAFSRASRPQVDLPGAAIRQNPAGQLLLEPVLVELTPRQASLLAPRLDELATLGLDCQPFGGSAFLVRSVPAIPAPTPPVGASAGRPPSGWTPPSPVGASGWTPPSGTTSLPAPPESWEKLPITPAAAFARALAEDAAVDSDDWLEDLCISLACRSAIRRGQPLNPHQRQSLLDGLREVAAPALCPHGSPLIVRLTKSYLTRAFEW